MLKYEGTDKIRDIKYEGDYVYKIYYDNNTQLVFTSDKEKTGVDEVQFKGRKLVDVTSYGKCEQNGTPTPDAPVDIVCNNGVLKARHQSGLPLGYTLLDYIESSGTQYIDTRVKITSTYQRVVSKFSADDISSDLRCFGSQDSVGNCAIVPWPATSPGYPWGYLAVGTSWYAPNGQSNPVSTSVNTAYEMDITANNGALTGAYCGQTFSTTYSGTLNNNLNITLFGNNRGNNNVQKSSTAKIRIYYYKLYAWENTLVPQTAYHH